MYCSRCGTKNEAGQSFCTKCGNNLNQNTPIQPQPVYQQPRKSGSGAAIVIICVILGILLLGILAVVGFVFFIGSLVKEYEASYQDLSIGDLTLQYNSTLWTEKTLSNNGSAPNAKGKALVHNEDKITIIYSPNDYITTIDLCDDTADEYSRTGLTVKSRNQNYSIDGKSWCGIEYKDNKNTTLQLFYSNGTDSYSFSFTSPNGDYDTHEFYATEIYNSIKVKGGSTNNSNNNNNNNTIPEEKPRTSKTAIEGEWDWGVRGYLVVNGNNWYLYKDSSKSMRNVRYGTFTIKYGIPTNNGGTADGYYIYVKYTNTTMDGVSRPDLVSDIDYAFVPGNDGTYYLMDLATRSEGYLTKIR
jgi:flagellar basal body-associated protein FliL